MAAAPNPIAGLRTFFGTYTPVDKDWAFQLWLDAWAEAARRPGAAGNVAPPQPGLGGPPRTDDPGRDRRRLVPSKDPRGAAWRIVSLLDGLALQVIAHATTLTRADVNRWAAQAAERELGLRDGALARSRGPAATPC